MEKLPGDILTDIVLRLPGKKVAQLRCVSKLYNSLLSDTQNIKNHSLKNNLIFIVCKNTTSRKKHSLYTVISATCPYTSVRTFPSPLDGYDRFVGSVDGLVCLSGDARGSACLYIWNPFLDTVRAVPSGSSSASIPYVSSFGFGVDVCTGDYRIVHVVSPTGARFQVEVFSFKEWGWKCLAGSVSERVRFVSHDSVSVGDGRVYWVGSVSDGMLREVDVVVWFDLGTESFGEVGLPVSRVGKFRSLSELRGRLCLFSYDVKEYCEVWVFEDGSWVKQHVVGSPFVEMMVRPLSATWGGEFLFWTTGDPLVFCDLKTGAVKGSWLSERDFICVVPYVDSLVWFPSLHPKSIEPEWSGEARMKKRRTYKTI